MTEATANVRYSIIFLFASSNGFITQDHTLPNGLLQIFISYCTCELCPLLVDARSRRAGPSVETFLRRHARFAFVTTQRESRERSVEPFRIKAESCD